MLQLSRRGFRRASVILSPIAFCAATSIAFQNCTPVSGVLSTNQQSAELDGQTPVSNVPPVTSVPNGTGRSYGGEGYGGDEVTLFIYRHYGVCGGETDKTRDEIVSFNGSLRLTVRDCQTLTGAEAISIDANDVLVPGRTSGILIFRGQIFNVVATPQKIVRLFCVDAASRIEFALWTEGTASDLHGGVLDGSPPTPSLFTQSGSRFQNGLTGNEAIVFDFDVQTRNGTLRRGSDLIDVSCAAD